MTESATPSTPSNGDKSPTFNVISKVEAPPIPAPADALTVLVTLPPGSPGGPPHRHPGPAFGYVIEGEILFEVEGEPQRVIRAGEAFWEPGGDVIHYQDANNLPDAQSQLVVVLLATAGGPVLTLVSPEELEERRHLRAPRG